MLRDGRRAATARRPTSIRVANAAASPLRYEMDPQEQYDALKEIEDGGDELLAIYHSHTKSAAYPSQTDVNQAVAWPDQIYVIVSLADEDAPDVKAYLLKDLRIADVDARRRVATSAVPIARRPRRWRRLARRGGGGGGGGGGKLVKVAFARNQAEAEMIQGLLSEARHSQRAQARPAASTHPSSWPPARTTCWSIPSHAQKARRCSPTR